MRLSKLKLMGFKSFVDSTNLSFPSERVGIVGPNGCGKSNVIDAVRWVMGESSAKQLRGASMSDVIFNGSRNRKPLEQASIELIFEDVNVPQYPEHSEIAVKRQISHKGQSTYFTNGVKCRRKDITDLFLGTGLGPRSYSIIEQGMISRFIEARPEELRVFFEEAAGVSKYKERRKETEQKMNRTRDNLARLDEVRNELDKQVAKLKRQANQAEKFQELKASEYLLKAQLQTIRWHSLDLVVQEQQQFIEEQAAVLIKESSGLENFDSTQKQQRESQTIAQETLTEAQTDFYEVEGEVKRLEQTIQHATERCEQLQIDLEQAEDTQEQVEHTLETDEQQRVALSTGIAEFEVSLEKKSQEENLAQQGLHEATEQLQDWQITWDKFNQRAALPTQQAQIEKARVENLEQRLEDYKKRLARLDAESQEFDIDNLEQMVSELSIQIMELKQQLQSTETVLTEHYEAVQEYRSATEEQTTELQIQQEKLHKLNGRLSSLETLQEAALGKDNDDLHTWLSSQGLDKYARLVEHLEVEAGWEQAVENVLSISLQALCIENMSSLQTALETPPKAELAIFETQSSQPQIATNKFALLMDKVKAPWSLSSLLAGVRIANTLEEAYQLRSQLADNESVVIPSGIWLGSHWLQSRTGIDEQSGILAREQEISAISSQLQEFNETVQTLNSELEQNRETLYHHENQREQAQQQVDELHQQLSQLEAQYSGKQARLEHIKNQLQRIIQERTELTQQIETETENLATTRNKLHTALEAMSKLADERDELSHQRDLYQELVTQSNQTWQAIKDERHKVELQLEAQRADQNRLQQGVERLKAQLEQLHEQRYELQQQLEEQSTPLESLSQQLAENQYKQTELEEMLLQAKQTVKQLEAILNDHEGERHRIETRCNALRTDIENSRMECKANEIRRQTLEEQLEATEFSPIALLSELPEYADEASWQAQIEAVERKLEKVGSVNMAALEEFEEQAERQKYLDEQATDLNTALNSLENAIKTIDKETKSRFKETINTINGFLQEMFPRLFGGGEASINIVGDDILKAGVTIMARPPGKRNTHIHLLSGGEKALTAIALVFAIFQLNPAPFCMLDEVDAPLDDSNVERFCALVKSMSKKVQFIIITHNKITMEIANQLIGVTMQEPGVSRLVTVDVDAAVDMIT